MKMCATLIKAILLAALASWIACIARSLLMDEWDRLPFSHFGGYVPEIYEWLIFRVLLALCFLAALSTSLVESWPWRSVIMASLSTGWFAWVLNRPFDNVSGMLEAAEITASGIIAMILAAWVAVPILRRASSIKSFFVSLRRECEFGTMQSHWDMPRLFFLGFLCFLVAGFLGWHGHRRSHRGHETPEALIGFINESIHERPDEYDTDGIYYKGREERRSDLIEMLVRNEMIDWLSEQRQSGLETLRIFDFKHSFYQRQPHQPERRKFVVELMNQNQAKIDESVQRGLEARISDFMNCCMMRASQAFPFQIKSIKVNASNVKANGNYYNHIVVLSIECECDAPPPATAADGN